MKNSIIFLFCYLAFAFSLNSNFQFENRYFPKSVSAFPFDTPAVKEGLPTPLPKVWKTSNSVLNVQNSGFVFESTGSSCDDLTAAFERYYKILFDTPGESFNKVSD